MAEFDVVEIDYNTKFQQNQLMDRLKLKSVFQIEQECYPSACIWYPLNVHKEDVLLTVNEDYKIKLWHIMSNGQKSTLHTRVEKIELERERERR